jgi:hypothetical protein
LLVYMLIEKFHAMHQILFFLFLSFFLFFHYSQNTYCWFYHVLHAHHAFNMWSVRSFIIFLSIYYTKEKNESMSSSFLAIINSSVMWGSNSSLKNNTWQ